MRPGSRLDQELALDDDLADDIGGELVGGGYLCYYCCLGERCAAAAAFD